MPTSRVPPAIARARVSVLEEIKNGTANGAPRTAIGSDVRHLSVRPAFAFICGSIPGKTAGTGVLDRPQASKAPTRRTQEGGTEHAENRAGSAAATLNEPHPGPSLHRGRARRARHPPMRSAVALASPSGQCHALGASRGATVSPLGGGCLGLNVRDGWIPTVRRREYTIGICTRISYPLGVSSTCLPTLALRTGRVCVGQSENLIVRKVRG
jgi:hypothetical protein